ncbi:MAG: peptide deformylase [Chloroflexi bacterium]|nr:peptide deformylase [Chloroflexota bacterium]
MAVREILQMGNHVLRQVARPVADATDPAVANLVGDLRDTLATCRAATGYGRAIAAPQVGADLRLVFLNVDHPWPLVNPSIVQSSAETMVVWDACLSFLSIFFQVQRNRWIDVRYQDLSGAWRQFRAEGDLSELLQHEIDHLEGILAVDRIVDTRTMCTREEFERRYRAESPYALRS